MSTFWRFYIISLLFCSLSMSSHHARSFLCNACILLSVPYSSTVCLGVVLPSNYPPPQPYSTLLFQVRSLFCLLTATLCPRKPISFTRSLCTSVTLICSPQFHYWQLLPMTDVSQSAESWLYAWWKFRTFFFFAFSFCSSIFIQMQSHLFLKYSFF